MKRLSDRIIETGGRSSGFDYLRLGLSTYVVLLHTVSVSYGRMGDTIFWYGPLRPFYQIAMPMFFALSGYLVAGSLERSHTIGKFLGLRAIRIYPALAVEVLLSALILGPLVTTLPLGAYFSNWEFWQYLTNVTGHIHYVLPGVYTNNPMPLIVNGQLWTIPFELLCYISLTLLAVFGLAKNRRIGVLAVPTATVALVGARLYKYGGHFPPLDASFPGSLLVVTFLAGVTIFLYRDAVPWNGKVFAASLVTTVLLLGVVPNGDFASPIPIAYMTVYLGLTNFRRIGFLRHADLSYGIFLYGYVVQQAVADLLPWSRHWYLNFAISLPLAVMIAALSWHFIERPALGLRFQLSRLESRYLSLRGIRTAHGPHAVNKRPISEAEGRLGQ